MIRRLVQSEIGALEVLVHSPTSAIVRTPTVEASATGQEIDLTNLVNRVHVVLRVDVAPSKIATPVPGKEYVEYLPTGPLTDAHTSIRKPEGDYSWEPSWTMRKKVGKIALKVVQDLLASPAFAHEAAVTKVESDLALALREQEKAREVLTEASLKVAALEERQAALQSVLQEA